MVSSKLSAGIVDGPEFHRFCTLPAASHLLVSGRPPLTAYGLRFMPYRLSCHHSIPTAMPRKISVGTMALTSGGQSLSNPRWANRRLRK